MYRFGCEGKEVEKKQVEKKQVEKEIEASTEVVRETKVETNQ